MDNQYNYYEQNEQQNAYHSSGASGNYSNNFADQTPPNNVKPKQKKNWKMPKALLVICFALVFGIVSSATFLGCSFVGSRVLGLTGGSHSSGTDTKATTAATLQQTTSSVSSDIADIAANAMPSVVSITNMSVKQVQNFFGQSGTQEVKSAGSGIIIGQNDKELLIVTNNHVIEDSETLTVSFIDENSVEANVKGTDATRDIAVVAVPLSNISADTMKAISVATLGDSDTLKVGEPAIAIGNALGYGQSVTTGIISATNRVISDSGSDIPFIQTDAAINPGNSGGALMNANGEVIGINSAKYSSTSVEGVGYAIPISQVSDIITNLMNQDTKTKVSDDEKGYIGIQGVDVTSDSAERYNMPEGVYVSSIIAGGGAESAGIQNGDIITAVNGTTIDCMTTLQSELSYYTKGTTVTVTVQRQNGNSYDSKDINVKLGAKS